MNFLKQTNNMRKFRIIIGVQLILVICSLKIFGQPVFKDSSQAYDYWSKRGIIEVIYADMNDFIATVSDPALPKEKIKDCTKELEGLKNFEENFIKQIGNFEIEELSTKLNELSSFLKSNNWPDTEENVFQPLLNNLSFKKALNNDFFSTIKPSGNEKSTVIPGYSNKMSTWNKTVAKILSAYNEDLDKIKPKKHSGNETTVTSDSTKPTGGIGVTDPPVTENQTWLFTILISLLSFFIGAFLCYYLVKSRIYQIMDEDLDKYKNSINESGAFTFLSLVKLLKERKNDYKNKVDLLKEELQNKKKIPQKDDNSVKFYGDRSENDTNTEKIEDTTKSVEWVITNETKTQTGLFFTIPDSEGKFEVTDGKSQNDGNCFYRIDIESNKNQAFLHYISNEKDKRAIENIENYLLPVCDIENFSDRRNASKVLMKDAGIVSLKHDCWVIETNHKVKIKLV